MQALRMVAWPNKNVHIMEMNAIVVFIANEAIETESVQHKPSRLGGVNVIRRSEINTLAYLFTKHMRSYFVYLNLVSSTFKMRG